MQKSAELFAEFLRIIESLRNPKTGCPWDLQQTHHSLRPYLIEEAYETLEAIDENNDCELASELGDVLLQIVLHAQIAAERGVFSIEDVISRISEKMIRRHPHVFGNTVVSGASEVVQNWEKIKYEERKEKQKEEEKTSVLSGVPAALPALFRAQRLGEKAAKVTFDWKSISGVWDKVKEELGELEAEITSRGDGGSTRNTDAIRHELGDLLFSICQLARWLDLNAEDCLRECCARFAGRFRALEESALKPLNQYSEEELEIRWQEAKKQTEK